MAISTYKAELMCQTAASTWGRLVKVKEIPDLGGAPDNLETTTTSDAARTYIPGIQENDTLTFTANYTKADFDFLASLKGTKYALAVWFGDDGADGKFSWAGYIDVYVNGGSVNEVVDMTITITPATVIDVTGAAPWETGETPNYVTLPS